MITIGLCWIQSTGRLARGSQRPTAGWRLYCLDDWMHKSRSCHDAFAPSIGVNDGGLSFGFEILKFCLIYTMLILFLKRVQRPDDSKHVLKPYLHITSSCRYSKVLVQRHLADNAHCARIVGVNHGSKRKEQSM